MSDGTTIEWTEATWNPITGCSVTSPGCTNCYAMKLAGTRLRNHPSREGLTVDSKAGPVWTGEVRLNDQWLDQPLRWKRPRMIFVCAHGDLFHESVPDEWIDKVFAVAALCPQHTLQILTKRSARMREYVGSLRDRCDLIGFAAARIWGGKDPDGVFEDVMSIVQSTLPNVWLGVSVEDQARARMRIPDLLATPAAVRWLSCEPLLGPVYLTEVSDDDTALDPECWGDCNCDGLYGFDAGCCRNGGDGRLTRKINWVVVGGESGPGARPMHPDWARSLRDQCEAAGVPFFFKQWGHFAPGEIAGQYIDPEKPAKGLSFFDGRWSECWSEVDGHCDDEPDVYPLGKKRAGRNFDGRTHDAMPQVPA